MRQAIAPSSKYSFNFKENPIGSFALIKPEKIKNDPTKTLLTQAKSSFPLKMKIPIIDAKIKRTLTENQAILQSSNSGENAAKKKIKPITLAQTSETFKIKE